jgi:hypothetical protein
VSTNVTRVDQLIPGARVGVAPGEVTDDPPGTAERLPPEDPEIVVLERRRVVEGEPVAPLGPALREPLAHRVEKEVLGVPCLSPGTDKQRARIHFGQWYHPWSTT